MAYLLIVDDDEDFARAAGIALASAGHEVRHELHAADAMKAIEERGPDLVILDVMFPEDCAAGFETARRIAQEYTGLKSFPILMVTAVNTRFPLGFSTRDIDEEWLPVSDFLEKPVDLELLREKVASLLAQAAKARDDGGDG